MSEIYDKMLIENLLGAKDALIFLHSDTIDLLTRINTNMKFDEGLTGDRLKESRKKLSFTDKDVVEDIIPAWGFILQDSINYLKCSDFREHSHWNGQTGAIRDMNNDIAFGIDKLIMYFKQFSQFEQVLYGIDANYRDHVVHVFRVWLLGMFLLLRKQGEDYTVIELDISVPCPVERGKFYSDGELLSIWSIISLCHDLGYPLEKTEKINESVEKMFYHLGKVSVEKFRVSFHLEHQYINKFLLDFISSKIIQTKEYEFPTIEGDYVSLSEDNFKEKKREFLEERVFSTGVQSKYYLKFSKSLENYRHGIISCSILLKSLIYFLESDFNIQEKTCFSFEDARQFLIRREILRSIAMHTCSEIYHLRPNSLSFLLILCDELQEWGRPRFGEMRYGFVNSGIESIEVNNFDSDKVEFTIKYSGVADYKKFASNKFRQWHELLRSAVDDSARNFKVQISLVFKDITCKFLYENWKFEATHNPGGQTDNFQIYDINKLLKSQDI